MPSRAHHPLRLALLLLAALFVILLLLATSMAKFWPEDDLRQRIATAASEQLAVPVSIDGPATLRLWPRPAVHVNDMTIGSRSEIAAVSVSLRWLPLLRGRLMPMTLQLDSPVIHLERDADGKLNIDPRLQRDDSGDKGVQQIDLHIRNGEIHWQDHRRGHTASVTGLEVSSPGMQWQPDVSLSMVVSADTISRNALTLSDVSFSLSGQHGDFSTDDLQMIFLESSGTGQATMDFNNSPTSWALQLEFDALQIAALPEDWLPGEAASGRAALTLSLTSHGDAPDTVLQHLNGKVTLSGRDLVIKGVDLDEELSDYESTQRFSLVDVAGVILAGPAWLAVSKGSEFARLLNQDGGKTDITYLLSSWEIRDGIAHAQDVAMATTHNRLAAKGSLDLPAREINDASVAVVNHDGCVVIRQTIKGTFDDPEIEQPSLVKALLGAPIELLQRGLGVLSIGEEECEVFYQGAIEAPG